MEKRKVKIGSVDGTFTAHDNGDRWNGFLCPRFEEDEARRFVEAFNDGPNRETARFDEEMDAVVIKDEEYDEARVFEADGQGLYPIGAHCWTWMKA